MGARFQVLFHSPPGVLFTFPSRYWCAIGHRRVFRLGWWSTRIRTGFLVPGPTQGRVPPRGWGAPTGLSPCAAGPPRPFGSPSAAGAGPGRTRSIAPCNPGGGKHCRARPPAGLAMAPFRSPLLGGSRVDFFSSGYLDVSVPRVVLPEAMCSPKGCQDSSWRVRPFGDPRVRGCVPLTADYRSLPRPSSASCAKASAVRP